ncbi:MAG: 5-(carboxyamino)imidazole ribonucleotide synthase [Gemmataceae bacterium]|nr:5-(carboxyamino)imidazole ribonucleotide synthase [Gemmataceae bacterium]MDW8265648.1 5-(carboxyamino)imidazole ribonucleotide synthase [Gemmataceae bacterium]
MKVGILGGGQLGRLIVLAGLPLGVSFRVLAREAEALAGLAVEHIAADYDDVEAIEHFAAGLDVATYEFENVSVGAVSALAKQVPVYPPPRALHTAQDRLHEKTFFQGLGIATPEFAAVESRADLHVAVDRLGLPAVLKARRLGYDGKGQVVITDPAEVEAAWQRLGGVPAILEQFISFDRELSLVAVRGRRGETAYYPLVENHHRSGILRVSLAPAPSAEPQLQRQAEAWAEGILQTLDYVGVLAIEWFEIGGRLLANEMAPRVHNSGHWTIEGAATSQFENHLRAILGWPLGGTSVLGCSALVNLIGTCPATADLLAVPGSHVHLYGKSPRPGRKLGHVTIRGEEWASIHEPLRQLLARVGEEQLSAGVLAPRPARAGG